MRKKMYLSVLCIHIVSVLLCKIKASELDMKYNFSLPWKGIPLTCDDSMRKLAFLSSHFLVSGSSKGCIEAWNITTSKSFGKIDFGFTNNNIRAVAPLSESHIVVGHGRDKEAGRLTVYDINTANSVLQGKGLYDKCCDVDMLAVLPEGKIILSLENENRSESTTLLVEDMNAPSQLVCREEITADFRVQSLIAMPSLSFPMIASGAADGRVHIWDLRYALSIALGKHDEGVSSLVPVSEHCLISASGKVCKVWDTRRNRLLKEVRTKEDISQLIRITSDIVAVKSGIKIFFYDIKRNALYPGFIKGIFPLRPWSLIYNEQNRKLVSASSCGITIWSQSTCLQAHSSLCSFEESFPDPRNAGRDQILFYYKMYKENPIQIPQSPTMLQGVAIKYLNSRNKPFLSEDFYKHE